MTSTIEKMAATAAEENVEEHISHIRQFQKDLIKAHAEYAAIKAERDALRKAVASHRYDVWGCGAVDHETDRKLYAALAQGESGNG